MKLGVAMVLVALIALPLAAIFNRVRSQRRALAAIQRVGGSVFFDYQRTPSGQWDSYLPNPAPSWLRRCLPEECLRDVTLVIMNGSKTTDREVEALAGLGRIVYLDLSDSQVTDAGLAHLRGQRDLEYLYLFDTRVSDAGMAHIAGLSHMRNIFLDGTGVTDAGLAHMRSLPQLIVVGVRRTRVGQKGVAALTRGRPGLSVYTQ